MSNWLFVPVTLNSVGIKLKNLETAVKEVQANSIFPSRSITASISPLSTTPGFNMKARYNKQMQSDAARAAPLI